MWRRYLCSVYCAVEPVPSSQVIIRLVFCFFPLYLMCWMDFWYSSTSPRHPTCEIISIQTPAQFQQGRKSQEGEIQSVFEVFVIPNRGMGSSGVVGQWVPSPCPFHHLPILTSSSSSYFWSLAFLPSCFSTSGIVASTFFLKYTSLGLN